MLSNALDRESFRVQSLLAGMLVSLVVLAAVLWRLQIIEGREYRLTGFNQSIRGVRLPSVRGRIIDRNGLPLAVNRPSYCIAVYIAELRRPGKRANTVRRVEETIAEAEKILGIRSGTTCEEITVHMQKRLPLPLVAFRDIGQAGLARWSELGGDVPGTGIQVEAARVYPNGKLGAHVIGYVGRADDAATPDDTYQYYLPQMTGRRGIEAAEDARLAGKAGGRLVQVDVAGFLRGVAGRMEPVPGGDVVLTMDAGIQRAAEDVFKMEVEGDKLPVRGAAVVIDPRNGDVLAMASCPSFDPNAFCARVTLEEWNKLTDDPSKPLINRAISEVYPPGSTFKPVVAIAALEGGLAVAGTSFVCPGQFTVGRRAFRCWLDSGHGRLGMQKALEQSCNVYFYQLALLTGYPRIFHMARALGFGHRTGIRLRLEAPGLLPDQGWKMREFGDEWRPGDTCNIAIGQGALSVTPLQMCVMTATVANGGSVYRPRLVRTGYGAGDLVNTMDWSENTLRVVRAGMYDVVNAPNGTGKRARIDGWPVAGKTGTAQYGGPDSDRKHVWMIAFAPFDKPRYAAAIVIENGHSGGRIAAPRMRRLMENIRALEGERDGSGRG